ncbi:MAG TPA: hypothetical protein PK217_16305, partial [Sphingopyxis terrae]|nr:hypothetical protein [Sphingopyxis terrae]
QQRGVLAGAFEVVAQHIDLAVGRVVAQVQEHAAAGESAGKRSHRQPELVHLMGGERRARRGCGKRTDGEDMSETHVFFGAN